VNASCTACDGVVNGRRSIDLSGHAASPRS
jgi:hypothetical protein